MEIPLSYEAREFASKSGRSVSQHGIRSRAPSSDFARLREADECEIKYGLGHA